MTWPPGPFYWDHPRGCGAHRTAMLEHWNVLGSSPRVRGSLRTAGKHAHVSGIIPAGAGLTRCAFRTGARSWDHPRGCGAHSTAFSITGMTSLRIVGSSPRVRGSHADRVEATDDTGIIPAGAGLTPCRHSTARFPRDHPRGCGAHLVGIYRLSRRQGSSPRVRGSPSFDRPAMTIRGSSPRVRGSPNLKCYTWSILRDHPRGCGAHSHIHTIAIADRGSSPRVRGSPPSHRDGGTFAGSSPRVRGSLSALAFLTRWPGIIPAGAGLT